MTPLERIQQLEKAATPGPWYQRDPNNPYNHELIAKDGNVCVMCDGGQTFSSIAANRDCIAITRNLLPELLELWAATDHEILQPNDDDPWRLNHALLALNARASELMKEQP